MTTGKISFTSERERLEAKERVKKIVHRILDARDYETLASLYARLSWQGFEAWLEIAFDVTVDEASDIELLHAIRFVEHVEAMTSAGLHWRG